MPKTLVQRGRNAQILLILKQENAATTRNRDIASIDRHRPIHDNNHRPHLCREGCEPMTQGRIGP